MAGAHAEGLPGSRQAEATLPGQPLLSLTQAGGPQQPPTPGRPWHRDATLGGAGTCVLLLAGRLCPQFPWALPGQGLQPTSA